LEEYAMFYTMMLTLRPHARR